MPFKDPEQRRTYQRERRQLERAGRANEPVALALPLEFRVRKAHDVLALLEEQLNALRVDPSLGTVERARCVGALCGVALRAIEASDLEARVEALEIVLAERKGRR